jgi:hypothetical protein
MIGDAYDDLVELEDEAAYDESDEDYGDDTDDVLDALMDSTDSSYLAERRKKRGGAKRGRTPKRGVKTAAGKPAYRTPPAPAGGAVTQKQLQDALTRVGVDIRRNAEGIKTVNTRLNTITGRVDSVVSVSAAQNRALTRLDKQMKIDGAFEFVEALKPGTGGASATIDIYQILKGVTKSGFLGDGTGAWSNPLVIGGIGLLLNRPEILGGFLTPRTTP